MHRTSGMPEEVFRAWTILHPSVHDAGATEHFVDASALAFMRTRLRRQPVTTLISQARIVALGEAYVGAERAWQDVEAYRPRRKSDKGERRQQASRPIRKPRGDGDEPLKVLTPAEKALLAEQRARERKDRKAEREAKYLEAATRYNALDALRKQGAIKLHEKTNGSSSLIRTAFLHDSAVGRIRVRNSTSTKLDYILNEVRLWRRGATAAG